MGSESRRPAQNHCIAFTRLSTGSITKLLLVHSLSPPAKEREDDDFGVSEDSGDVKERRLRTATLSFFTKVNGSP